MEIDQENYHLGNILGIALCDKNHNYILDKNMFTYLESILQDKIVYTYNAKLLDILARRKKLSYQKLILI